MQNLFNTIGDSYFVCIGAGMQNFTSATIISTPTGTPVAGSPNTFVYPILSSVILTCDTVPSATNSTMFTWNITGCTTCFPFNEVTQNVTTSSLTPDDAGTFTCTADDGGDVATSDSFILRVSCKLTIDSHTYMHSLNDALSLKDKVALACLS